MVQTGIQNGSEFGIGAFLRARAAAAADSRLAIDVAVGTAAVIVAVGLRPEWWLLLASAGVCLAAFGIWAALERASVRTHSVRVGSLIGAGSRASAWIGIAAALATGFFFWTFLMGTWIS